MRRIFTLSVSILLGIIVSCLSLKGQEGAVMGIRGLPEISTKADPDLRLLADSSITYTMTGEQVYKNVHMQSGNPRAEARFKWENNKWIEAITDEDYEAIPSTYSQYSFMASTLPYVEKKEDGSVFLNVPNIKNRVVFWGYQDGSSHKTEYNKSGSLKEFRIFDFIIYKFEYDALNRLKTVEEYNSNELVNIYRYDYYGDKISLFEHSTFDSAQNKFVPGKFGREKLICKTYKNNDGVTVTDIVTDIIYKSDSNGNWVDNTKDEIQYDGDKRTAIFHYVMSGNRWIQYMYTIFNPFKYSSSVNIDNNESVGSDNEGGFDIITNTPVASIASGSFIIKLPEGFKLNNKVTSLYTSFAYFDLKLKQQEDKTWLLEINPKATKSNAVLRADDVYNAMAHIGYTVDPEVKYGTYDIQVYNIEFQTPAGSLIAEPAIEVPVKVNRWALTNEAVDLTKSKVWTNENILYILANEKGIAQIYSVNGQLMKVVNYAAGETVNETLVSGIYIVKMNDGKIFKVIM